MKLITRSFIIMLIVMAGVASGIKASATAAADIASPVAQIHKAPQLGCCADPPPCPTNCPPVGIHF